MTTQQLIKAIGLFVNITMPLLAGIGTIIAGRGVLGLMQFSALVGASFLAQLDFYAAVYLFVIVWIWSIVSALIAFRVSVEQHNE